MRRRRTASRHREVGLGVDIGGVRLGAERLQPVGQAFEIEEGADLRLQALDAALVGVERAGEQHRHAVLRIRSSELELAVGDEAPHVAAEQRERGEAVAREIIFEARVVIPRVERHQEGVAARARFGSSSERARAADHRGPQVERGIELLEERPGPGLRRREAQLPFGREADAHVRIGQPVGIFALEADRLRPAGRAEQGARRHPPRS